VFVWQVSIVPDPNVFVVFSTYKKELVSKNFACLSSGFVYLLIVGAPNWKGGSPGWWGLKDWDFLGKGFVRQIAIWMQGRGYWSIFQYAKSSRVA